MNAVDLSAAALSLWLCSAGALAAGETNTPAITWLDGPLAVAAAQSRGPGLAGAIYRGGELVELFAWGGSGCVGGGEIDPNAAFEVGSIAKHMTAVGLLRLWEEGRIELDAPVERYVDDIPETWRAVTIRQLLTHTGGVPDYEEVAGYGIYETSPAPAEVFAIVSGRPLDFEPGTRWSYSNTGYYLLSLVIERISGMAFGDYMRERVFDPLQLEIGRTRTVAEMGASVTGLHWSTPH